MSQQAIDILVRHLARGLSPEEARRSTIHETSVELGHRLKHASLEDALHFVGINSKFATEIRARAISDSIEHLVTAYVVYVSGGGGAAGIPTPECLRRHLPPDREPTEEEIDEAVRACRANPR